MQINNVQCIAFLSAVLLVVFINVICTILRYLTSLKAENVQIRIDNILNMQQWCIKKENRQFASKTSKIVGAGGIAQSVTRLT